MEAAATTATATATATTKLTNKQAVTIVTQQQQQQQQRRKALGERTHAVRRQKLMVFFGNCGVLSSGMVIALPAVTLAQLLDPAEPFTLNTDESSWFSSMPSLACPLGGLLVSYFMDRIGRKLTILCTNLLGLLGWLLLITAYYYDEHQWVYAQMLTGRAISGIMIGMFFSPVGVYAAEISLPRIRGRLIMGTSIALASGILLMYVLGYFIRHNLQLIATISCSYQLLSILLVLPMPESPSWLLQKGQPERARKALAYFRGLSKSDLIRNDEFESELKQIKRNVERSRNAARTLTLWQTLKLPEVYKPLLIMTAFLGFQQCSGIVVVIVYAVQLATRAGVSIDPFLVAVMIGIARILTTFCMGTIFERWGRRPAGIVSAAGMSLCMSLLAAGCYAPELLNTLPLLPVICIVAHIVFSTMGLLTLPFFMLSEVFPQNARGIGSGIAIFFGMVISFVVLKIYPSLDALLGTPNLLAIYALCAFLAIIFIYYLIPETRGRTLLEIEEYFRSGKRLGSIRRESNLKEFEFTDILIKH